jgi:hypothetical protein
MWLGKRSNEYVKIKDNKILPNPKTMQGISTSTESMEIKQKSSPFTSYGIY